MGAFNFGSAANARRTSESYQAFSMDDLTDHKADLEKQQKDSKSDEEHEALQREIDTLEKAMRDYNAAERSKKQKTTTTSITASKADTTLDADSLDP
mmetsp:Transcript_8222/g.10752  ORF Transcript_8222/g.10752 Transcript_8222/m.10752 type:complete len:97 (-) Transcript_8222:145-435(-)